MWIKQFLPTVNSKHGINIFFSLVLLILWQTNASAQYYQNESSSAANSIRRGAQTDPVSVRQWFQKYDAVRRQAQMKPAERLKADAMMSKGLSIIVPGAEKAESQQLLLSLVARYHAARQQLEHIPLLKATEELHRGYYQYFTDAEQLFSDYLRVQDNLFATDTNGQAIAGQLLERKQNLESLDQRNKYIDEQLRQQNEIAPYRY